jgi:hypothetical protein
LARAQAYAAARFAESVLRGLEGEPDVYEAAYVQSSVTELPYFATKARGSPLEGSPSLCCTLMLLQLGRPKLHLRAPPTIPSLSQHDHCTVRSTAQLVALLPARNFVNTLSLRLLLQLLAHAVRCLHCKGSSRAVSAAAVCLSHFWLACVHLSAAAMQRMQYTHVHIMHVEAARIH